MDKKVVYIGLLSFVLVLSLMGNLTLYSEINELNDKIIKLTEQDKATDIAKQFVQLFMMNPTKENEAKLKKITTDQAQKDIFSSEEDHEPLEGEIQQEVVIDNTYFNRKSLKEVNVIVKYRINYQIGDTATSGEYEINVDLIRIADTWKVDTFKFEQADTDLDPVSSEKEEETK
ncbi:hypothetical protein [Hazenella coriacea]|uniref:DUF4829 domain-containing protein n=1 Tax=Hazenella coriacea TaxID=1179467 RepID=A0A4R3L7C6_9BACL|nr:hypothetical protein [Hazenella coriacea]TCS94850.1 hypothetical protein EDD58_103273 [Hazenella coriacea]